MARPPNADSARTVENITSATLRLLADEDSGKVGMRAVARSAGVSVGTVGYYFATVNELIDAALEMHYGEIEEMRKRWAKILSTATDPAAAVAEVVRDFFRFCVRNREFIRVRMRLWNTDGQYSDRRQQGFVLPMVSSLAQSLIDRFGLDPGRARFTVQSVSYLLTRFSIAGPTELAAVMGMSGQEHSDVLDEVERHLVDASTVLVFSAVEKAPLAC